MNGGVPFSRNAVGLLQSFSKLYDMDPFEDTQETVTKHGKNVKVP